MAEFQVPFPERTQESLLQARDLGSVRLDRAPIEAGDIEKDDDSGLGRNRELSGDLFVNQGRRGGRATADCRLRVQQATRHEYETRGDPDSMH
jgi:hypothetical protein